VSHLEKTKRAPLGEIAPAVGNRMPDLDAEVWNLSLDEIGSVTGRVLSRSRCKVRELGSSKCAFDERHVLYSKLRPYLNKVVLPDGPGVGTSELIPMRPDPARLDREYLAYYLRSPDFLDFAARNTRGANLPRISMRSLWRHEVPLPGLEEQRRIVARIQECLGLVGEIEKLRTQTLQDIENLPTSVFGDRVDGLTASQRKLTPLGEILVECRYGTSRKANSEGNGVPVIRMGNIRQGRLDVSDLKYVHLGSEEETKYLLTPGDILINRTNSLELVGKSAVFDNLRGDWVYASYLIRLRVDPMRALPAFVNAAINSRFGREYVLRTARRAIGMVNINAAEIKRMPIPLPPRQQQECIVEQLEATTKLTRDVKATMLDQPTGRLRDSILLEAFAGEL
jgi:type I restriction enzyme, S subunit